MSASSKKKLRKEEQMAKLTERQMAEQKEAKKLKTNSIIFTVAIGLVLVIGLVMLVWTLYSNSGIGERNTKAVEIGGHTLSVAEFNYYYIDYLNELQQDSGTMSQLALNDGLDISKPLNEQPYKGDATKTWGDYFIEEAIKEASGVYALCDAAKEAGYTLPEADVTAIDETVLAMETQGMLYGYSNLNDFLEAIYGKGARKDSYRSYVETVTLAQSYYNHYTEQLNYTDDEIAAYEKENGS